MLVSSNELMIFSSVAVLCYLGFVLFLLLLTLESFLLSWDELHQPQGRQEDCAIIRECVSGNIINSAKVQVSRLKQPQVEYVVAEEISRFGWYQMLTYHSSLQKKIEVGKNQSVIIIINTYLFMNEQGYIC